jgi:hypothetical protein
MVVKKEEKVFGYWIKKLWNIEGLGSQMTKTCFLPQQNITIPNRLSSNKYVEEDGRRKRGMG